MHNSPATESKVKFRDFLVCEAHLKYIHHSKSTSVYTLVRTGAQTQTYHSVAQENWSCSHLSRPSPKASVNVRDVAVESAGHIF